MTTQQRDQLRSKKRKVGQDTLEKKWEGIYQLLFPDDMPPLPSPCKCDEIQAFLRSQ